MEKIFGTGYPNLTVVSIVPIGTEFYSIVLNKIEETIVHKSKIYLQKYDNFAGKVYCINDIKVDKDSYDMVKSALMKS
jgi:hypothetical protein